MRKRRRGEMGTWEHRLKVQGEVYSKGLADFERSLYFVNFQLSMCRCPHDINIKSRAVSPILTAFNKHLDEIQQLETNFRFWAQPTLCGPEGIYFPSELFGY
jgi:hypothetical protein